MIPRRLKNLVLTLAPFVAGFFPPAFGQAVLLPNFSSTAGLTLNSSATASTTTDGAVLRLATNTANDRGSVFTSTQRNVASGFSTTFSFRFSSPGGTVDAGSGSSPGADGIVFVVQRVGATALGATGEGLGFLNLGTASAGVEFDTWQNSNRGDPNSSHVGVNTAGSVTSLQTANVAPNLDNGSKWTAWVDYNGSVLEVRLSQDGIRPTSSLLSHSLNIATVLGGNTAFVGFTGATGGAFANQDILSWVFSETYQSAGITMGSWSGSGSWSDPARWQTGAAPGASDAALFSSGTALINDVRSLGVLQFSGGTIGGTGILTLLGAGSVWSAGALNGTGTLRIAQGGSIDVVGAVNHDFARGDGVTGGRTIENAGTVRWSEGNLRGGDGATFANVATGVLEISGGGTFGFTGSGNVPTFSNAGTVRNSAGNALVDVPFTNNNGTVQVTGGRLEFNSTFTQNSGTLNVANGGTLKFNQGLSLGSGTLSGTGTVIGNVTSGATISPGSSPGTLTFTGGLSLLSTSQLIIEIGGLTQGTGYDFVSVSGAATLAGTLKVNFSNNGFISTINAGNTFTFLTASSLSGVFANAPNGLQLATEDGLGRFTVNYTGNSVSLSNFTPIPEPSTYALVILGLVVVVAARRRR